MKYNFIELKSLLEKPIPPIPKQETTFFDIGGFGHRENIISNFYIYFLDPKEDHGLGDIFMRTLLELIEKKSRFKHQWDTWEVYRECSVELHNGLGLIDIWIEELGENSKAILIENKIYHSVNNDLEGYISCPELKNYQHKIGILLTPKTTKVGATKYINLTHLNWIEAVRSKVVPNKLTERQRMIFDDFCNNFNTHVHNSKAMMERHLFYLKNRKKIQALIELKKEYKDSFIAAIEGVAKDRKFKIEKYRFKTRLIQIELSISPRVKLEFEIYDDITTKPISAYLCFCGKSISKKAKPIQSESTIFNKFKTKNILKENRDYDTDIETYIAYKDYSISDLKRDSFEKFLDHTLDNDWIPFMEEAVMIYRQINQ